MRYWRYDKRRLFTRYDIFYFYSSLFVPYLLLNVRKGIKGLYYLLRPIPPLFLDFADIGARLPVVSICLGSLALVFALNREWLKKRTKLIIIADNCICCIKCIHLFVRMFLT